MRFEKPPKKSRSELLKELSKDDPESIAKALISAALHDPDRDWLDSIIVEFVGHKDPWVRGGAALAAGHVARLHRALDSKRIRPLIEKLLEDPRTRGKASDALDDMEVFLK